MPNSSARRQSRAQLASRSASAGGGPLAFAGYDGGRMARERAADLLFVVPSHSVHRIQEVQTALAHLLLERACAT